MSLNQRVKDAIHSPESEAASRGEVDSRTPGAFPTDDMNAHTSDDVTHHERNKLHKSNDPRASAHQPKDSGVGMMDRHNDEHAATREPVEEAYAPAAGEEQEERAKRSAAVPGESDRRDDGTAPGYDEKPDELGTTLGGATMASNDKQADAATNTVRTGKQQSTMARPDPYWGNMEPGQGHGVYNTVTGHGSKEDEARHSAHTGSHDNNTSGTSRDHRAFPLVGHNAHASDPTRRNYDDTTTTSSYQPGKTADQTTSQHEGRKSNWDGPVGAAVLGAAGTSTFASEPERNVPTAEGDNDHIRKEGKSETRKSESSSDKKHGGVLGMFHRSDKEKEAAKEQKKEEKLMSREEEKRLKEEGHRPERENHQPPPDAVAAASTAMRNNLGGSEDPRRERPMYDDGRPAEWHEGDGPGVPTADPRVVAPGPGARVARDIFNHNHPDQAVEGQPLDGFGPYEPVKRHHYNGEEPGTTLQKNMSTSHSAHEGQHGTSHSHPEQSSSTVPIMGGNTHPSASQGHNDSREPDESSSRKHHTPAAESRAATTHIPHVTEEANEGHYNTLSSGTPSGVKIDDSKSHGQSHTPGQSSLPPTVNSESANRGAMATTGIAGSRTAGQEQGSGCPAEETIRNH